MSEEEAATTSETPAAATPTRRHRVRRVIAWVLVVVVSIFVPLSVVTAWAVKTVTNTDRYVATIAPVVKEKVVTDYAALRITDKLFSSVNVQQKLTNALPKKADFIAAPVTTQLKSFTETRVRKLLQSEWFYNFWTNANRRLHGKLVDYLTGTGTPVVQRAKQIGIDLTPAVNKAIDALDAQGVTVFDPVKSRLQNALQFQLLDQQQVKKVRGAFHLAKTIGWVLPLVTLILLALALIAAVDRRKTLLRAAVGSAIAIGVFQAGFALGRTYFISQAPHAPSDVTGTLWDTMLRYLHNGLHDVLVVVILIAIVCWFVGPSSWARGLRRVIARAALWLWHAISSLWQPKNRAAAGQGARRVARWCGLHSSGLRLVGVVVAGSWLIIGGSISDGTVWLVLILLAVFLILLEVVFAWARRLQAADDAGVSAGGPDGAGAGAGGKGDDAEPEIAGATAAGGTSAGGESD